MNAGASRGGDLIPHECQERRDDHRDASALGAQERSGQEVDSRLAPAGPLHDQSWSTIDDEGLDRLPLVVP